ncbi:MAG: hypothetical protein KBT03_13180 [Bacteroidales bacterium]|nr:hypothetical protein [Candidatus Scybalousia scybalohippi]
MKEYVERSIEELLEDGWIKVGSKSYCTFWMKGSEVIKVNNEDDDHPIYSSGIRDQRLMVFTSLMRTLDFISHPRVHQGLHLFLKFEKEYPLIDGYTRTGRNVDHNNMRKFLDKIKGEI